MYVTFNIHKPLPGKSDALKASMHRYGAAVRTQPGLLEVYTIEATDGALIGLAVWESKEACDAGRAAGRAAVKDDPFDEWESEPVVGYQGESC
jgi:heme-degrading monooxygenase HmoA